MTSIIENQVQAAEQEWLEGWRRGPTRLRWSTLPPQVGDYAPDFKLQDSSGQFVRLHDFLQDGPALLLFWRHYGCGCGLERARRLQQEYAEYIGAGASVVIIGQAEPERSAAYAQQYQLPACPVLCDPQLQVYQAYGLLEGQPSQIVHAAGEAFLRRDYETGVQFAKVRREAGRPPVDSPWQMPGEFVVQRDGIIRLAYHYQYCEDYPNHLVLMAAIKKASAAG